MRARACMCVWGGGGGGCDGGWGRCCQPEVTVPVEVPATGSSPEWAPSPLVISFTRAATSSVLLLTISSALQRGATSVLPPQRPNVPHAPLRLPQCLVHTTCDGTAPDQPLSTPNPQLPSSGPGRTRKRHPSALQYAKSHDQLHYVLISLRFQFKADPIAKLNHRLGDLSFGKRNTHSLEGG